MNNFFIFSHAQFLTAKCLRFPQAQKEVIRLMRLLSNYAARPLTPYTSDAEAFLKTRLLGFFLLVLVNNYSSDMYCVSCSCEHPVSEQVWSCQARSEIPRHSKLKEPAAASWSSRSGFALWWSPLEKFPGVRKKLRRLKRSEEMSDVCGGCNGKD